MEPTRGKRRLLVGVISSPLGGPGAARKGAWADLRGFPWAIPFRVGSVKEKRKDTGFEWWPDQTRLLALPRNPVHSGSSPSPVLSGSLAQS